MCQVMALKPGCNCGFVDIIDMSYPQVVYRFMGGLVCVVCLIADLPLCAGGFFGRVDLVRFTGVGLFPTEQCTGKWSWGRIFF